MITEALENSSYLQTTSHPHFDGYSLSVYGLDNGQFYSIHLTALICIFFGFLSVAAVIYFSFKSQKAGLFFDRPKSERFVVYIALCDGLFNITHFFDHMNILITHNHVYPKALCTFYSFMLVEFTTSQKLMVNVVAINAFMLIYFKKKMDFGHCDWRLFVWIFGVPLLASFIAMGLNSLGPNGFFCYFDGIRGEPIRLIISTIPLITIIIINIILYILTWYRLRVEEPRFKDISGNEARIMRASCHAARNMILFVVVFLIQWWPMGIYGVWKVVDRNVPIILYHLVTTFTNIGGVLNGIVFVIISRRKLSLASVKSVAERTPIRESTHA